jgi:hypothetical protein
MSKIAHIITIVVLLSGLFECDFINNNNKEEPVFSGLVLFPDDTIYASGERIFVYWNSTNMSDIVTISLVCVDNTSLPGYSSSAVSNEIYVLDIDSKIASDKNWQIVITDKKNKAITVKSKPFLVKNDTLIPQSRKSFWYTCSGKCNNSDITEYIQIGQNQIYTWTKTNKYTEGRYSNSLYSPPLIDKNRLLLAASYNYWADEISRRTVEEHFYLISNDTLLRIRVEDLTVYKNNSQHFQDELYYIPLKGQIPPANWPQKIRTDSTLKSGVQGEWALFSLISGDSSRIWKDDSVKYSLTLKNDSGFIFYNNAQILSFTYNFKNFELNFFPFFLKLDTLENIAGSGYESGQLTMTTSGNVSDNFDTIVFKIGYLSQSSHMPLKSQYNFRRIQHN